MLDQQRIHFKCKSLVTLLNRRISFEIPAGIVVRGEGSIYG